MPSKMTMHFLEWLSTQTHRDDLIGDVACDAERDEKLSNKKLGINAVKKHLRNMNADSTVMASLNLAYAEYRSYVAVNQK